MLTNRGPQPPLQRRKVGAIDLNRPGMRVVTLRRAVRVNRPYLYYPIIRNAFVSLFFAVSLAYSSAFAEIQPTDCSHAAKYSESRRGAATLVMQNGRTIFEHYANG